LKGRVKTGKC